MVFTVRKNFFEILLVSLILIIKKTYPTCFMPQLNRMVKQKALLVSLVNKCKVTGNNYNSLVYSDKTQIIIAEQGQVYHTLQDAAMTGNLLR